MAVNASQNNRGSEPRSGQWQPVGSQVVAKGYLYIAYPLDKATGQKRAVPYLHKVADVTVGDRQSYEQVFTYLMPDGSEISLRMKKTGLDVYVKPAVGVAAADILNVSVLDAEGNQHAPDVADSPAAAQATPAQQPAPPPPPSARAGDFDDLLDEASLAGLVQPVNRAEPPVARDKQKAQTAAFPKHAVSSVFGSPGEEMSADFMAFVDMMASMGNRRPLPQGDTER